jgi:hypothetical protein
MTAFAPGGGKHVGTRMDSDPAGGRTRTGISMTRHTDSVRYGAVDRAGVRKDAALSGSRCHAPEQETLSAPATAPQTEKRYRQSAISLRRDLPCQ